MIESSGKFLDHLVTANKRDSGPGITSLCSSHPVVLEAAFLHAKMTGARLLIESTCNQVNQFGGYTGQTPEMFSTQLSDMATQLNFSGEHLIMGGDHLGPEVWKEEPAAAAMEKARRLVKECVAAGYIKIHLDASMKLGDDPSGPLLKETAAARAADLVRIAEDSAARPPLQIRPRYVIGTEVPLPGGAHEVEETVEVTTPDEVAETIEISRKAFADRGLEAAWERVIAVVVQPSVEYGDDFVVDYRREAARGLTKFIESQPLVYEAHSTDYQRPNALSQLVADHFAILKVGPALTFAFREAVFALAMMEDIMLSHEERSNIVEVLEGAMVRDPRYWAKYYHGDEANLRFARKYSFSDRSRYYWPVPEVRKAVGQLINNLQKDSLPLALISQYMPEQYEEIRSGELLADPRELIRQKIYSVLGTYHEATTP